ncbi:MAG: OsmC family peroxiredoxin [Ignavibacteriales bacterium]|jgi:peroxiredoxin-like protein|nr:MAG: OsmC family peroxiredoxin [Ignavibacteriales bacterium]
MDNVHYYNTTVKWTEGRKGELIEPTMPTIEVATPPEFPKGVPNTWSPEHLYVASANICLMTTFLAIAENSKLDFKTFECDGVGKLEIVDGRFMISEIVLKPKVVVAEEKDIERAQRIVEKAENHCLISNSMKTEIKLEMNVVVE